MNILRSNVFSEISYTIAFMIIREKNVYEEIYTGTCIVLLA